MQYFYDYLFSFMWTSWLIYWLIASRNAKKAKRSESRISRMWHLLPLSVAALLLWLPDRHHGWLFERILPHSAWMFWAGAEITAMGLLFSVWARVHLAGNWSAVVTLKENHELIVSGPYRLVRHPVYTGLLLAFAGSGLAWDQWRGVVTVLIVLITFWRKLRIEEQWLTQQFGEAYTEYRRKVAALIPHLM